MKLLATTIFIFILQYSFAQSYADRYSAVDKLPVMAADFGLKGNVQTVSTKKYIKEKEGDDFKLDDFEATEIRRFNALGKIQTHLILKANNDTTEFNQYQYDAKGQLTKYTDKNGRENNFTYKNGVIIKIERKVGDRFYLREYKYDSQGRLISDRYSENGKPIFEDILTYTGNSKEILTCLKKRFDTQAYDCSSTETYTYHDNGQIAQLKNELNEESLKFRGYEQKFDRHGNLLEAIGGDSINQRSFDHIYNTYNKKGDFIGSKAYHIYTGEGDATQKSKTTYVYDKQKNWTKKETITHYAYSFDNKVLTNPESETTSEERLEREIVYH
jgi:YD repeat-containing protein